jgi:hypothetical protein
MGQNWVQVSGLSLPFVPTDAECWTSGGSGDAAISGSVDRTTLSSGGATFNLSGAPADGNQTLGVEFLAYIPSPPPAQIRSLNPNETFWQWPQFVKWQWVPESLQPLASTALTGSRFEETLMNLIGEFLSGYFNESLHVVDSLSQPVLFPVAQLVFQQNPPKQPIEGTFIQVVLADPGVGVEKGVNGQYQMWQKIMLEFYIRSNIKEAEPDGVNRDLACRRVSDRLYALLCDRGASIPLQQKGFKYLRPHAPGIRDDTLYSTRCIRCHLMTVFNVPASNAQNGGQVGVLGGD